MGRAVWTPLIIVLLAAAIVVAGAAAQAQKTSRPFARIVEDWERTLGRVEQQLRDPSLSAEAAAQHREQLQAVRAEAIKLKAEAEREVERIERLTEALGPAPAEDAEPEPDDVTTARAQYAEDNAFYRGRVTHADLAILRAEELEAGLSTRTRAVYVENLLRRYPLPVAPGTLAAAVPAALAALGEVAAVPAAWWSAAPPRLARPAALWLPLAMVVLAVGVGWAVRVVLLRKFGRDPAGPEPSYTRRFVGAVAEAAARGIVPALVLAVILYVAGWDDGALAGRFGNMIAVACVSAILFVLAWAVPRAVLAPDLPAWRLAPIAPDNARALARRISLLAGLIAVDYFLSRTTDAAVRSPELGSVYLFVANGLEGAVILSLMRVRLWRGEMERTAGEAGDAATERPPSRLWPALRIAISVLAVAGIVASAIGYSALGLALIKQLLLSGIVVGALFVLRGLIRELVGVALRSVLMRQRLSLAHATRSMLKFWLRAALDVSLVGLGLFLLVPVWAGVAVPEVWAWTSRTLQGFTIGNVTISVTDIAIAIAVFALAIMLTRVIQRALSDRILPQTHLDTGVQHSLAAGFGYIGLVIAAALGIASLGIDLSNIALIAGALSVGIGFGLQNVVNNFVSGLILLVERPIKVGDWVAVGGNEGFVKRINVRATELETFQRASVIIPNADLLSSSVVNMTHKDRYGRIEIAVGVAYGSDTEQVRDILLDCARRHERVLARPEPFVLFQNFGDSSLDFELRCYTGDVVWRLMIASDLRFEIDRRFREADIEIPFPQRVLHHAQPAPADDLSRGADRSAAD